MSMEHQPPVVGRPRTYPRPTDPGISESICERLVAGESMHAICMDGGMPREGEVYIEMARNEEFRSLITRAREFQQEAEIEKTVQIADNATPEDVHVAKLRIWARQWRAGKLAPKKYGDKTIVSGDPENPLKHEHGADQSFRTIVEALDAAGRTKAGGGAETGKVAAGGKADTASS